MIKKIGPDNWESWTVNPAKVIETENVIIVGTGCAGLTASPAIMAELVDKGIRRPSVLTALARISARDGDQRKSQELIREARARLAAKETT